MPVKFLNIPKYNICMFSNPHKTCALGLITKEKSQRDLRYKPAVAAKSSCDIYYKFGLLF